MIDLTDDPAAGDSGAASNAGSQALQAQVDGVLEELEVVGDQLEGLLARQAELRAERDKLQRLITSEARAPKADWARAAFPWDAEVSALLRDRFGLQAFRPLQREVINATLQGRDVLALLPSGGGKSLLYQLTALADRSPGVTLVVSPLLSLIADQVLGLTARNIPAAALTSLTPKEGVKEVYSQLETGQLRLLYVTPERIAGSKQMMAKLQKAHAAGLLARVAVDEVHCCSSWGNDYRPDYRKLGLLKQQFPAVPLLAVTATATQQVCEDVQGVLHIRGCEVFRSSINRPNLFYEVRHKPASPEAAARDIAAWIRARGGGGSGIVYALTRKDTEKLAADLVAQGVPAVHYHADMAPKQREAAHRRWSGGRVQVVVATIAFGMGIDKPDTRWVIHASPSKSLENYYQESGRAGRDGLPATCLLFYRFSDVLRQAAVSCTEPQWQPNLMAMTRYAQAAAVSAPAHTAGGSGGTCTSGGGGGGGSACRRATLQAHFAEAAADCRCMCDLCCAGSDRHTAAAAAASPSAQAGPSGAAGQQLEVTMAAADALRQLQAVQASGKKATINQLVDAWRSKKAAAGEEARRRVAALGGRDEAEALVGALLLAGLVQLEFGFTAYATNTYLQVTRQGAAFVDAAAAGKRRLVVTGPLLAPGMAHLDADEAADGGGSGAGAGVQGARQAAARQLAAQACVFPHSVLSPSQLQALAARPPGSCEEVEQLLGSYKAAAYGAALVRCTQGAEAGPSGAAGGAAAAQQRRPDAGGGGVAGQQGQQVRRRAAAAAAEEAGRGRGKAAAKRRRRSGGQQQQQQQQGEGSGGQQPQPASGGEGAAIVIDSSDEDGSADDFM